MDQLLALIYGAILGMIITYTIIPKPLTESEVMLRNTNVNELLENMTLKAKP